MFFREFIKNRTQVGSIIPSSRYLTKKMIGKYDFKDCKCIVEFGPGTGPFTFDIINKMGKDTKLIIFELNEAFYNSLKDKIDDPRVEIYNESASEITNVLQTQNMKADYIISSLPLTVIPKEMKIKILQNSLQSLIHNGKYIQFQYSLNDRKLLRHFFKKVNLKYTIFNFPPAFVYECS